MASNSFGRHFRIITWGESHGPAIGVVIDGCPAGILLNEEIIYKELSRRAPGNSAATSPRKESDRPHLMSGIFEGKTTGAPISIVIYNQDFDSSKYEPIKNMLRPGHSNSSYLQKYGLFDHRGGGRSSGRETACRVAAGAVAKQILKEHDVEIFAMLHQVGSIAAPMPIEAASLQQIQKSQIFCPCPKTETAIIEAIEQVKKDGDSLGGVVGFLIKGIPAGLGDPVYEKIEANLAKAFLSLPASKGFEIGRGFESAWMRGSEHNDPISPVSCSNNAGGTLGGITTGLPIYGKVVFKPTSSIMKPQNSLTTEGKKAVFQLPEGSRHDPCVAIRAVPVVEAMAALVIADSFLSDRLSKI